MMYSNSLNRILVIVHLLLIFSLFGVNALAQGNKYQITAVLTPSYEQLNFRKMPNIFEHKLSYNAGFEYKLFLTPDLSFTTGLQLQNKGFSTRPVYFGNLAGPGNLVISARYINAPLTFDYHIPIVHKFDIIISGGITAGILVHQSIVGKRIDADLELNDPLLPSGDISRSNIDWFNRKYFGYNVGFGFCKYIMSKLVVIAQPMYRRQANATFDALSPIQGGDITRLDSYSFDIKVGYYFNPQIGNKRKSF
jgi:hypothetical protein